MNNINMAGGDKNNKPGPDIDDVLSNFDSYFEEYFPAPELRENQKEVVEAIVRQLYENDKDVVLVDAPPGFGKSISLWTAMALIEGNHYYVTPLKSLQKQLVEDGFIGNMLSNIKGRANYSCVLPDAEPGTTVDVARCQREKDFECDIKSSCPYYSEKDKAVKSRYAVMNLSYMMSAPFTLDPNDGQFSPRETMTIDECQSLEDWAINFIGVTVSKNSVPKDVWDSIDWPRNPSDASYSEMVDWLKNEVLKEARDTLEYIEATSIMSESDIKDSDALEDFIQRVERFLNDQEENEWVHTMDFRVRKNKPNVKRLEFKPITVGRFLDSLVWSKAEKFIMSSATIPKGDWLNEIGLGDKDVARLNVPSPFPKENRQIVTEHAVGKMTYNEREENMPDAVEMVKNISQHHAGEKGIIHCRGYNYIELFKKAALAHGHRDWYNENVMEQDRDNRERSLEEWLESDKQIFMSVNMAEGIDLKGDKARWQCLLKTLYPNMGDERVNYRVSEMNDWEWYNGKAVVQMEQAYGRIIRSKDDWGVTYILDESAVGLMKRSRDLFHDWFLEGVIDL